MFRRVLKALPGFLTCMAWTLCAQPTPSAQSTSPPKELIQYIREAEKAGQSVFQIQQNAVDSGWPMPIVTAAITLVHDEDAEAKKKGHQSASAPASESALAAKPAPGNSTGPSNEPIAVASSAVTPATGGTLKPSETTKPAETAKPDAPPAAAETIKPVGSISVKPDSVNRGVPDDYQIGAGDSLEVNVWKEPDASVKGAMVRTDGKISMPLLKEVAVVGLTPVQLEKQITDELTSRGLITTPDVTIIVTGTGSKKIYVQGKVKKEGPIPFNYRMTVMQALSEAGGLTDYANKKKIYILRTEDGKTFRLPFDYSAVLKGQHLELNIQLQANDMIVVP
jgi:polysaccharide biosynthesis/export protein